MTQMIAKSGNFKKRTIYMMVLSTMCLAGAFFVTTVLGISGCNSGENGTPEDTATSGRVHITVDETFAPIITSEINTFQSIYKDAKIDASYKPEAEAINDLLNDSSRIVIVTRKLNEEEEAHFRKLEIIPHTVKICYDAIAVIVNPSNRDTLMDYEKFKDVLSGKISKWNQAFPGSGLGDIQVIFDNQNSSTVRHVKEMNNGQLTKNGFAVKTNSAVIDYVSKHKNSVGVIGVSWISDKDDSTALSFLKKVRVMGFNSTAPNAEPGEYYQPFQAYIAQKVYPLTREVYIISREARMGLGSGFTTFIASEKGQRIFLKSGLVPAIAPVRLVELKKSNIKITNDDNGKK